MAGGIDVLDLVEGLLYSKPAQLERKIVSSPRTRKVIVDQMMRDIYFSVALYVGKSEYLKPQKFER